MDFLRASKDEKCQNVVKGRKEGGGQGTSGDGGVAMRVIGDKGRKES